MYCYMNFICIPCHTLRDDVEEVEKYDNGINYLKINSRNVVDFHASFKKIVGNDPIIDKLVKESAPIILKIKKLEQDIRKEIIIIVIKNKGKPLCSVLPGNHSSY